MSVYPFFEWWEQTALADVIRNSTWLFPAIMVVHLLGLAWLGATILAVDLRLIGGGRRGRSARDLARDLQAWMWSGLALTLGSGVLLFASEALRCYETPPFWYKMAFLAAGLAFTATVRRGVLRSADGPRWRERVTGGVSLVLWSGVAVMGRMTGFW